MFEWGGHHGGWGGFGPPSYIVKKCPEPIINRKEVTRNDQILGIGSFTGSV